MGYEIGRWRGLSGAQGQGDAQGDGPADMAHLRARVAHHLARVFGLRYVDEVPPVLDDMLAAVRETPAAAGR